MLFLDSFAKFNGFHSNFIDIFVDYSGLYYLVTISYHKVFACIWIFNHFFHTHCINDLGRHVFAKPPECHILASYQMWFCQKLLKNAKNNSKIVKIWWFLWNLLLVAPKSTTSIFFGVFDQFLATNYSKTPKTGSCGFWYYQMWFFTKIAKSRLFYCNFWRFSAIFGQTTSGSLPKQDILDLWQKHVWAQSFTS